LSLNFEFDHKKRKTSKDEFLGIKISGNIQMQNDLGKATH